MRTLLIPKLLGSTSLACVMLVAVSWLLALSADVQANRLIDNRPEDGCLAKLNAESTTYSSVQAAIDASTHATDVVRVSGTCVGVESRGGLSQTVYISKDLTLQGGWNSDFSEHDLVLYPSTLDAQGNGRVIFVTGYISSVIEGLRITGGIAYDWAAGDELGGGLGVISASVMIRDNQLSGNTSSRGGGIYLRNSDSMLDHNLIFSNTATDGGGIFVQGGHPRLQYNTVVSNAGSRGGGLYVLAAHADIANNQYAGNSGRSAGGGVYIEEGVVEFSDNTVTANTTTDFFALGSGLMVQTAVATLTHNLIANNIGSVGGGAGAGLSDINLDSNLIVSNTGLYWGGGVYMNTCTATLVNNVVADNRTEQAGSGIFIYASKAQLLHNTIARNRGGHGVGILIARYLGTSHVELTNTILVSHTVGISVTSDSTATLHGTLWGTNEWANTLNWYGTHVFLTASVGGTPNFVDPYNHDYHLLTGSAAIDAGVFAGVTTDIEGHSRLPDYGGLRVDIGAYESEYQGIIKHVFLPVTLKNP